MFSHFLIAYVFSIAIFEGNFSYKLFGSLACICLFITIHLNHWDIGWTISAISREKNVAFFDKYNFLRTTVKPYDLILCDMTTSWYVPSFNGKVIGDAHPVYWIPDYKERRKDVSNFFTKENSDSLRQTIVEKYNPDYVLLDSTKVHLSDSTQVWLKNLGKVVYERDGLELIKLN